MHLFSGIRLATACALLSFSATNAYSQEEEGPDLDTTLSVSLEQVRSRYEIPDVEVTEDRNQASGQETAAFYRLDFTDSKGFKSTPWQAGLFYRLSAGDALQKAESDGFYGGGVETSLAYERLQNRYSLSLAGDWQQGRDESRDSLIADNGQLGPREKESRNLRGSLGYARRFSMYTLLGLNLSRNRYTSNLTDTESDRAQLECSHQSSLRQQWTIQTGFTKQYLSDNATSESIEARLGMSYRLDQQATLQTQLGHAYSQQGEDQFESLLASLSYLYLFTSNRILRKQEQQGAPTKSGGSGSRQTQPSNQKMIETVESSELRNSLLLSAQRNLSAFNEIAQLIIADTAQIVLDNQLSSYLGLRSALSHTKRTANLAPSAAGYDQSASTALRYRNEELSPGSLQLIQQWQMGLDYTRSRLELQRSEADRLVISVSYTAIF